MTLLARQVVHFGTSSIMACGCSMCAQSRPVLEIMCCNTVCNSTAIQTAGQQSGPCTASSLRSFAKLGGFKVVEATAAGCNRQPYLCHSLSLVHHTPPPLHMCWQASPCKLHMTVPELCQLLVVIAPTSQLYLQHLGSLLAGCWCELPSGTWQPHHTALNTALAACNKAGAEYHGGHSGRTVLCCACYGPDVCSLWKATCK